MRRNQRFIVISWKPRTCRLIICRCHYKGSTFPHLLRDPECWSGRGLIQWPFPARQTGAHQLKFTRLPQSIGQHFVAPLIGVILLCSVLFFHFQSRQLINVIGHLLRFTPKELTCVNEAVEWKVSVKSEFFGQLKSTPCFIYFSCLWSHLKAESRLDWLTD